jgi:methionine aminopeptidase
LKTRTDIDGMAAVRAVVAEALQVVVKHAKPVHDGRPRSGEVGTPRPAGDTLIEAVDAALAGIAAVRPGNTLGDVGQAIGSTVRAAGCGLLADDGGHVIGRTPDGARILTS